MQREDHVTHLAAVGTYLPPWAESGSRRIGRDEDAVTLAVSAAQALVAQDAGVLAGVSRVVLVTRDLPLLDGGNGAALLAGLGLRADVPVVEQVGGAADALAAVTGAAAGTLVVAVDAAPDAPAGAAAALVGDTGAEIAGVGQVSRSLPVRTRDSQGATHNYDDPRLMRERGTALAISGLGLTAKPDLVAGLAPKLAAPLCAGRPEPLPTVGASSALFALATAVAESSPVLVVATDQGSASAVTVAGAAPVGRDEPGPLDVPTLRDNPGSEISISLAAYERAFEPKLRWEAGKCDACGALAFPPRHRCLECGSEDGWSLTPLPRLGTVYTGVTIHVPVPGLPTPYSLVIVELDSVGVRALVKVTGAVAGSVQIDDRGELVLRRVAVRSGVPDYGYAFRPVADANGVRA